MKSSRLLTTLILFAASTFAACTASAQEIHLKPEGGAKWYRGVTHFHTLWSDGDCAPEVAVKWYLDHGYDFISISDHNILAKGDVWFPVKDEEKSRLTSERLAGLKETFGDDWVVVREQNGRQEMRLKTLEELTARFADPGSFLIIPGEEITAPKAVHINAINIADIIAPVPAETALDSLHKNFDAIEAHIAQYGLNSLVHLNHPNFSSHITAEEIISLGGERVFEVYNGHDSVRNWGDEERHILSTDRLWDIILSTRFAQGDTDKPMLGVATDDAHDWFEVRTGNSNPGRGWIMVLAEDLSADSLITAVKQGRVYPTSGVMLDEIHVTPESYTVHIRPEAGVTYTTQFIGTLKGTDVTGKPLQDADGNPIRATHEYSAEIGKVLAETTDNPAVYRITGDEMYVRAKVISSKPKNNPFMEGDLETAWTQPVRIP